MPDSSADSENTEQKVKAERTGPPVQDSQTTAKRSEELQYTDSNKGVRNDLDHSCRVQRARARYRDCLDMSLHYVMSILSMSLIEREILTQKSG